MYVFLVIVYVLVALFLIMVVLLQSGKGASMGAAFGGSAQTMFGTRGKASGIEKTTVVAAVLFMVISIALASLSAQSHSALDEELPPKGGEAGLSGEPQPPSQPAAEQPKSEQPPPETKPDADSEANKKAEEKFIRISPDAGPPPGAVPVEPQPSN